MEEARSGLVYINFDYFFGKIYDFGHWIWDGLFDGSLGRGIAYILGFITIILLYIIFYSSIRLREIREEEKKKKEAKLAVVAEPEIAPRHEKWQVIQAHIFSNNQAEWRLAIIEADTILEELTLNIGLPGMTLGDRLKNATSTEFPNVQVAWEAHKVRNRIAHDGSAYELTQAEANRVIRMYEDVFNSFNYI